MLMVRSSDVPVDSLLSRCVTSGAYADCYVTEVPGSVSHAQFVEAFYTTALFKLERLLLAFLASPSTDTQAKQLAEGQRASFAAWSVEARTHDQLLLSAGRTRSWLMVAAPAGGNGTRLFFGSAVVPRRSSRRGLGPLFDALVGLHKVYSRALLLSARMRLSRQGSRP